MPRFKSAYLPLLLSLLTPAYSFGAEAHYCIATAGGFGHGGTTFIGQGYTVPAEGVCVPWSGFTKTASSVILQTSGSGCLSSDGTVMTISVTSADPAYLGGGNIASDYIRLARKESTGSFSSGSDNGYFGGSAEPETCSTSLLHLPDSHD